MVPVALVLSMLHGATALRTAPPFVKAASLGRLWRFGGMPVGGHPAATPATAAAVAAWRRSLAPEALAELSAGWAGERSSMAMTPLTPAPPHLEDGVAQVGGLPRWRRWLRSWFGTEKQAAALQQPVPPAEAQVPEKIAARVVVAGAHRRLTGHIGEDLARSVVDFLPCFMLAWVDDGGAVYTWEFGRQSRPRLIGNHSNRGAGARFLADGESLVTVANNGLVIVWNTTSGRALRQFRVDTEWRIDGIQHFPDGERVIIYATSSDVEVWNASSGEQLYRLNDGGQEHEVKRVLVSPNGRRILIHSRSYIDHSEHVSSWSADTGRRLHPQWSLPNSGCEVALLQGDKLVVCERSQLSALGSPRRRPWFVVCASTGRGLVEASVPGEDEAAAEGDGEGYPNEVRGLCVGVSDDGSRVAQYEYSSQQLTVWDTTAGLQPSKVASRQHRDPLAALQIESARPPSSVQFLCGGTRLLVSRFADDLSQDGMRYLWDPTSNDPPLALGFVWPFGSGASMVTDGRLLATQWRSSVRFWDVRTSSHVLDLELPLAYGLYRGFFPWAERPVSLALSTLQRVRGR